MKKFSLLLFATYLLVSCSQPAGTQDAAGSFNLDSVKAAIDANNKTFIEAIKKGDSAALVATYTVDGCLMPTGSPKLCGAEGMGKFLGWTKGMGMGDLKFQFIEITGGKELVSEEGTYEVLAKDGASMEKGKYIVTWKQEKGQWKKYRDIWNSDMPPPPAAPAKK